MQRAWRGPRRVVPETRSTEPPRQGGGAQSPQPGHRAGCKHTSRRSRARSQSGKLRSWESGCVGCAPGLALEQRVSAGAAMDVVSCSARPGW